MTKKKIYVQFIAVIGLLILSIPVAASNLAPVVGEQLPYIKLAIPKDSGEKSYLGLSGFGYFSISKIKAKTVIIEIFSMYCPYCQKEASNINQLYSSVEQNPALKGNIKIIGIGVGNSLYEVAMFKTRYKVPFPLFADGDYVIHKQLGEVRTPYFIVVKINSDGSHRVVYSKLGAFESVDKFLAMIASH